MRARRERATAAAKFDSRHSWRTITSRASSRETSVTARPEAPARRHRPRSPACPGSRRPRSSMRNAERGEAARLVAAASATSENPPYQRLIHQPPHIDALPAAAQQDGAVSHQIRHADRAGGSSLVGIETEQRPADRWASLPLPIATRSRPTNEMSIGLRLAWIVTIAVGAAFSAGMYLAGLESLTCTYGSESWGSSP